MSDLRDRIAAAIKAADKQVAGFISYKERADAVIAELGLTQERRHPIVSDPGMTVGRWKIPTQSRYVTEWETDD